MAFYQNLKLILDEKKLTNYEAANKCGIASQTIDYQIKNKVEDPKPSTLKKLSVGLNVSINRLMYGTDTFESEVFYSILKDKDVTFEDLILNTAADPTLLIRNEIPPKNQQNSIANYLNLRPEEIFRPSRFAIDYLKAKNVKPYVRPDIDSEPHTEEDMRKLYDNLSPISKRLVYNLAYDLSVIETENIVKYKSKDYWEK